jgi:hypothetical protein
VFDSAYIAASRRSDRSLEARIESARRASEIHKKRTGRGLRVTEQDVINEEMYEEEEEDLPTQYQRLSAHLHTGSLMFNRKLHDYIATQHGVRNLFLQQYQPLPGYGPQVASSMSPYSHMQPPQAQSPQLQNPQMQSSPMQNSFMGQQMMLPPQFSNQSAQPHSPRGLQQPQAGFRQAPYSIPQRSQHGRSASIPAMQQTPSFTGQNFAPVGTPQTEEQRRLSLPPHAIDQTTYQAADDRVRPSLSRNPSTSPTVQKQPASPQNGQARASATPPLARESPPYQNENFSSFPFMTMNYDPSSQVLNMNPLSFSMPPESQQFIGSALDPNDPHTPMLMAGSEYIPQPFGNYKYNPNIDSKMSRADETSTNPSKLSGTNTIKLETPMGSAPSSHLSLGTPDSDMFSQNNYEYSSLFSEGIDFTQPNSVQTESEYKAMENDFINADAWGA